MTSSVCFVISLPKTLKKIQEGLLTNKYLVAEFSARTYESLPGWLYCRVAWYITGTLTRDNDISSSSALSRIFTVQWRWFLPFALCCLVCCQCGGQAIQDCDVQRLTDSRSVRVNSQQGSYVWTRRHTSRAPRVVRGCVRTPPPSALLVPCDDTGSWRAH